MTEKLLHFTLGPVQGFVAQARRTRDLWAGSFLLSWLTGQAMKAVDKGGGKILVPDIRQDAVFRAMSGGAGRPAVGSLPNRFKARAPDGFDPRLCRKAIDDAWHSLAGKVWARFVAPVAGQGNDTRVIWDRQVESFWETAWITGPQDGNDDHTWLDRRKNWRSHCPPVEGGDHCMLMGDWQEISGFVRSHDRKRQDAFWRSLKGHVDQTSGNPLQLDQNERLCAVALIKRLFPHVARDVLGWEPSWDGRDRVRWPSTPRLAATSWLRHAWETAPAESRSFVALAQDTRGEIEPEVETGNALSRVAGHLLHESGIEYAHDDEIGRVNRDELRKAYARLKKQAGEPSAFYALLLMDGDRVGALLRKGEQMVTEGLARFSAQVDGIVRQSHGGNTIYAGGDDVLALLPLEGALPAALDLRKAYSDAFPPEAGATISAAVIFAHFHVPLRHVLHEAHRQLDDVAKDGNGRDGIAMSVLTQSGVTREWVSKWDWNGASPPRLMAEAAREISEKTSGGFFYAVREQLSDIIEGGVLGSDEIKAVLLAEYRRSEAGAGKPRDAIAGHVDRLSTLAERHAGSGSPRENEAPLASMDGPLVARFLARETRRT